MTSTRRVSVIIPCYNNSATIVRAVESVINDSYGNKEVVVVNDGSSDDSFTKLMLLEARYPKQINIINQTNSGANNARNAGLKFATGDYIQFLDADDFLLNNKLSASLALMNENSELCCVYSDGSHENRDDTFGASHENIKRIVNKNFSEFTFGMNTNMPVWKNSFLKKTNEYWDESLGCWHEADYFFRLLLKLNSSKEIKHIALNGFSRRLNENGISSASNSVKYVVNKVGAIDKIVRLCEKTPWMNHQLREQSDRFMWLLFKHSVLSRLDEALPAIQTQHKNKTIFQQLAYKVPASQLRVVYKVLKKIIAKLL